MATYLHCVYSY